jgi:hypothetical protein
MDEQDVRKVSIKMPADLLKQLSQFNEQNQPATDDQGVLTLQATPQQVQSLTELRKDLNDFQNSQSDEWHRIADRYIKTCEIRITFYERLVLLAGGSFALSLTYLGSLHRYAVQSKPLVAMGRLNAAWILLLVCIVLCWVHNLYRSLSVETVSAVVAKRVEAMQHELSSGLISRVGILFTTMETPVAGLGNLFSALSVVMKTENQKSLEGATAFSKELERLSRWGMRLGFLAFLSIVLAFVFLLLFAIKNSSLL